MGEGGGGVRRGSIKCGFPSFSFLSHRLATAISNASDVMIILFISLVVMVLRFFLVGSGDEILIL